MGGESPQVLPIGLRSSANLSKLAALGRPGLSLHITPDYAISSHGRCRASITLVFPKIGVKSTGIMECSSPQRRNLLPDCRTLFDPK
jgi:hypothetical protein